MPQKETEIGAGAGELGGGANLEDLLPSSQTRMPYSELGRKFALARKLFKFTYLRVANVQDGYLDLAEMKTISIREVRAESLSLSNRADVTMMTAKEEISHKLGRGFNNGVVLIGELCDSHRTTNVISTELGRPSTPIVIVAGLLHLRSSKLTMERPILLKVASQVRPTDNHRSWANTATQQEELKAFRSASLYPQSLGRTDVEIVSASLTAIDCKIDLHRRKRAVLEELFKALLHKLMTGEIRVGELGFQQRCPMDICFGHDNASANRSTQA